MLGGSGVCYRENFKKIDAVYYFDRVLKLPLFIIKKLLIIATHLATLLLCVLLHEKF